MWVCRNCKEANDSKLNYCITCKIPKDITEHEVVEDYQPDSNVNEGHLTLSKGDVITVLKKGEDIWRGKIGRQEGLFPKQCVEDKISTRQIYRVITPNFDARTDHLKVEENDVVTAINRTSDGLLWVQFQGKEGWIPETHLEKAITDKVPVTSKIAPKSIFMHHETRKESMQYSLQRPCHWKKYEVLYDFKSKDCKYLELLEGDIIFVVGGEENGWFLAQVGYDNGLVPATYVHLLENQDDDVYRVKALYLGEEIGSLNLQIGDTVNVVNRRTPGWLWVNHNETEGWYPENHLTHYDNTSDTDDADEMSKPNKQAISGTNIDSIAHCDQGGVNIRRNIMTTDVGFPDRSSTKPSHLPERRKLQLHHTTNESTDITQNIYGNSDPSLDELNSVPPPIPARRKSQAIPIRTDLRELSQNTYGNSVLHDDRSSTKPPHLPERRKLQLHHTTNESNDLTQNIYGNSDPSLDVEDIKKKKLKVMEYEEPKTTNSKKVADVIQLDETDHVYDYITDSYLSCAEIMSKKGHQPAEHRIIGISEKPELPKRPPPPARHSLLKSEDKTRVGNEVYTAQMATLYGRREQNEIRLVMLGKTGSGKSATGNTIMTKANHFLSKLSGGSVTNECKRGECNQAGRKIVVIDTPGLFDTQAPREQISKEIVNCVNMSTPGPHVFLLVVQIARFTDEEIETFNRLFDLFGAEMGRFAIITFTKLDDIERDNTTIEAYINEAPGKMKEFLKRCHGRYIAFDNNASEKKKTAKVKSLIQLVDSIVNKNGGKWYTNKMYREAEAALQRKIKVVEEEKALEKKKEIERIQSTFVNQIDSIKQDNKKLAKQISSKENQQRQIQKEKEKALQEIQRMKEEMKKIDKKRNEDLYRIKKQETEEKEKQANALEEKERQQMQFLQGIQEQQIEMNRKYQEMEQQKELQLSKAAEQHSKIMEAEIQRIVDGNNQKYNELMKALESKDRANEKLQDQMAQQNASMQEIMRERNETNNALLKQQEENIKRMAVEKKKAEHTLRKQLEEQRNAMDDKTKEILQNQMDRDKKQREEFEAATLRANEIIQARMEKQNALMQNLMREKEQDFLEQQENQKKSMDAKTQAMLQKQNERDEIQMKEFQELKLQNERMQEQLAKGGCSIS